jgi:hypothetical protein
MRGRPRARALGADGLARVRPTTFLENRTHFSGSCAVSFGRMIFTENRTHFSIMR